MGEILPRFTTLEHLQSCAESSRKFTDSRIGDIAGTVAEVLEELDEVKADKEDVSSALSGKADASHGLHVEFSTLTPKTNSTGTAGPGSATTVARSDHVHPTDTTRAAASHTHGASDISSGTLVAARLPTVPVTKGGTGKTTVTNGSYLVGNGTSALQEKTASQVLSDIGAAAASHTHTASDVGAAASGHSHTLTDLNGTLSVAKGGTGATDASAARSSLGAAAATDLSSHTGNTNNPHGVTAAQIGLAKVCYATCATAAATQAKEATVVSGSFALEAGQIITIKFTNAQSYNGQPTLNVGGLGAKNICKNGTTAGIRYQWSAGEVVSFLYDGTNFIEFNGATATTTYYGVTKLSSSTTSTSGSLAATPLAVSNALAEAKAYTDTAIGAAISASY